MRSGLYHLSRKKEQGKFLAFVAMEVHFDPNTGATAAFAQQT